MEPVWRGNKTVTHAVLSPYGMHLSVHNSIYQVTPSRHSWGGGGGLIIDHIYIFKGILTHRDQSRDTTLAALHLIKETPPPKA